MKKWEYKRLAWSPSDEEGEVASLNRLGDEGWELVSTAQSGNTRCHFLKRPVKPWT